tara:strand:+ start:612 stop:854 length:243 start_codon:yes stop_codon:yes gene_type:complete
MENGMLVQFVDFCNALTYATPNASQMQLWPTSMISPGEVGILIKSQFYDEVGDLCEVLIGDLIFLDIPSEKFEILPTPTS